MGTSSATIEAAAAPDSTAAERARPIAMRCCRSICILPNGTAASASTRMAGIDPSNRLPKATRISTGAIAAQHERRCSCCSDGGVPSASHRVLRQRSIREALQGDIPEGDRSHRQQLHHGDCDCVLSQLLGPSDCSDHQPVALAQHCLGEEHDDHRATSAHDGHLTPSTCRVRSCEASSSDDRRGSALPQSGDCIHP